MYAIDHQDSFYKNLSHGHIRHYLSIGGRNLNDVLLFHGTDEDALENIEDEGLRMTKSLMAKLTKGSSPLLASRSDWRASEWSSLFRFIFQAV